MQTKYYCKTPIKYMSDCVYFLLCFIAETCPGAQLRFKWGGKKAQGGNSTRGEVWTFSSGCSPVREAANVKRHGCEFPNEIGLVQRECEPISNLLSYLGTAVASICQLFMVATWGKRAPPLHFRREAPLLWQRGISGIDEISRTPFLVVCNYACMSFLVKCTLTQGKKAWTHNSQYISLYNSEKILIRQWY